MLLSFNVALEDIANEINSELIINTGEVKRVNLK